MRQIDADALKVRLSGCMIMMPNGEKCTAERAIDTQGTVEADIDRAAIMRLCNEIEDEVTDIAFNSTHYHIRDCCEAIRKYLEEIGNELTGDAGTD